VTATPRNGRIVTFYSYKGGTGRSMALANVGWILASTGRRVLLIDWDLEAPGLHRYFHPFIAKDKELASTPGLMDFFVDFSTAARIAHSEKTTDERWFESFASLVRYASPVNGQFENVPVELVSAGRQDAGYAVLVTSFNWQEFYGKLGGGVFLEALKQRLRHDYDFVLIDSRTGISDTSGICTVQMPDELVVLYTLNDQSMKGAASVADTADRLRRKSTGEPGLRIWPVPTRIELAEKDRLDAAHDVSRQTFERYIGHLPRRERSAYWERVQVLYQAYYAYEEVLAPFADRSGTPNSMLSRMEVLAGLLAREPVKLARISENLRLEMKKAYERPTKSAVAPQSPSQRMAFVSYSVRDADAVEPVVKRLRERGVPLWYDRTSLRPGDEIQPVMTEAIRISTAVLYFIGEASLTGWRLRELELARAQHVRIVPILVASARYEQLPDALQDVYAVRLDRNSHDYREAIEKLVSDVQQLLELGKEETAALADPDDPQKGRWGGEAKRNGRELTGAVRALSEDYFEVTLEVRGDGSRPLTGDVEFHLHPTFAKALYTVPVADGRAELKVLCWGAFTVGAVADSGQTTLELDLAEDSSFPQTFRER
jgi:MinD-like ATPase involved in chromosome partitioning or flagellar assembly